MQVQGRCKTDSLQKLGLLYSNLVAVNAIIDPMAGPSPYFLCFPFWLEVSQGLVIVLTVGFTSATSVLRLAALPYVLYVPWYISTHCGNRVFYSVWASIIGSHSSAYLFQYIEVALLSKSAFPDGPTNVDPNIQLAQTPPKLKKFDELDSRHDTVWNRLRFGLSTCFDSRMIDTRFQVKGVPPFSSKDPGNIPTRNGFIYQRLKALLLCYLVLDVLATMGKANVYKNVKIYSLHLAPFFRRLDQVTTEQLIVRTIATAAWWINIYCLLDSFRSIVAILCVAMRLTPVTAWRPWFGPMREAYTLRRFWR